MKRRIMMIVCAMMLVLGMAATSFAASATIKGSTENAKVGETVTVSFVADKGGYMSFKAAVSYDAEKLELTKLTNGTQNLAKGIVSNAFAEAQEAGTVFTAEFKVLEGEYTEETTVPVSFEMKEFFGEGGAAIDVEEVAGAVVIAKTVEDEPPVVPEDPQDPVEPEDPADTEEPAPEKSADTDDNFNIALFGALALAAVAAGGCTVFARRRG